MSPKELRCIEDALNREKQMRNDCADLAASIQDPELKSFVEDLSVRHQETFAGIYSLLI